MHSIIKFLPLPLLAVGATGILLHSPLLPLATTASAADAFGHHRGAMVHAFLENRLAALGITDTQKQQLHNILRDARPRVQPLVGQFVTEKRALRGLVQSGAVDEAAIRAQVARVSAVGADLAVERARIAKSARAVLTPEQIDKIGQFEAHADAHVDAFVERLFQHLD